MNFNNLTEGIRFINDRSEVSFFTPHEDDIIDVCTSGSTLREILKPVRTLAPDSKIFIFTLIGNERNNI